MAIPYANIVKAVALKAVLSEGTYATREAAYVNADPRTLFERAEIPFSSLKDDILRVEKNLAEMIGNSTQSIYRTHLKGVSAALTTGDDIPTQDAGGNDFIGVIDAYVDSVEGRVLKEADIRRVERFNNQTGLKPAFTINPYLYAVIGTQIYHTSTTAYARGCVWDYATQSALIPVNGSALGDSPLPQSLETIFVMDVLEILAQGGFFMNEGQYYANISDKKRREITDGKIQLLTMPEKPRNTKAAAPAQD